MLEEKRQKAKSEIRKNIEEFSGVTRWNRIPHKGVIEKGTKFCDELMCLADNLEDEIKVSQISLFSNLALVIVAQTSAYEEISNEELDAFDRIFDVMRALRSEFLNAGLTDEMFDKIMYFREIFLTNTICREDYDCKYRQSMPFPDFALLYNVVNILNERWEVFAASYEFKQRNVRFCEMRHFGNNNNDDALSFSREFLKMLEDLPH